VLATVALTGLDDVGVVGLGVLADGLRKPIGVDGPIVGPADWQGIGFGSFKSDGQEQAIRALGATPALVYARHPGLADHLEVPDGDIRALRDCEAIHVGIEGASLSRGELSASARALAEAERDARGEPTPASEVTRLKAAVEATDLVRPMRWLVLVTLLLAGVMTLASAAASGSPGGAVGAIVVLGALWGLAERVGGWHILEVAHRAEEWWRLRVELWLERRLEPASVDLGMRGGRRVTRPAADSPGPHRLESEASQLCDAKVGSSRLHERDRCCLPPGLETGPGAVGLVRIGLIREETAGEAGDVAKLGGRAE